MRIGREVCCVYGRLRAWTHYAPTSGENWTAMREHMSREERDLVRELVNDRVRDLARDYRRERKAQARAQARPCVYCGKPTQSRWRACPAHIGLVATDPDYNARYYR